MTTKEDIRKQEENIEISRRGFEEYSGLAKIAGRIGLVALGGFAYLGIRQLLPGPEIPDVNSKEEIIRHFIQYVDVLAINFSSVASIYGAGSLLYWLEARGHKRDMIRKQRELARLEENYNFER